VRELSDEVLADLKLALTEAASNSVRHAYPATSTPASSRSRTSFDPTVS
jgi:anti-sigma regulatory factor (Ser/Thr protein kinase)